jgi:hypothetical protein
MTGTLRLGSLREVPLDQVCQPIPRFNKSRLIYLTLNFIHQTVRIKNIHASDASRSPLGAQHEEKA